MALFKGFFIIPLFCGTCIAVNLYEAVMLPFRVSDHLTQVGLKFVFLLEGDYVSRNMDEKVQVLKWKEVRREAEGISSYAIPRVRL